MRWSNVLTIFSREARDQLRDRRTLFMILVLPVLLYPILGIGVARLATAFEQKPKTVVVVGAENLPAEPALLDSAKSGFDVALFDPPDPVEASRLKVIVEPARSPWADPKVQRERLRAGDADVVVVIPPDVTRSLREDRAARIPVAYDAADEASQVTRLRVDSLINRWKDEIVSGRLKRDKKSESYTEPVRTQSVNVATGEETGRGVWAKLFPFLLVMMALTGAFYPAVDICAGEKERGTMETLLISPASRAEIVAGKFLTVMCASMITALLNLGSMAVAGIQIAQSIGSIGGGARAERVGEVFRPPSLESGLWIVLLLIPLSAFFSALCIALAVLARSMKEGQYYMTPLYLVAMPLILVTLSPGIELKPFTALVPITGASLLLKTLMQGDYELARRYFLLVLLPTVLYSVLALRWAVDQFQKESVLFRESERFELAAYFRHLIRDRGPRPSAAQAILCFVLLISATWFLMMATGSLPPAGQVLASQVLVILGIPVVMSLLLTNRPAATLRLGKRSGRYLLLGLGLALALNPIAAELRPVVDQFFPMTQIEKKAVSSVLGGLGDNLGMLLLLVGVLPAICEEIAFRGFILSGFESEYRPWSAILISAFLFGFLHALLSVFSQLFNATLLGLVLGLLAVRSGSILPGILFHMVNNSVVVLIGWLAEASPSGRLASTLFRKPREGLYQWPILALCAGASVVLLTILVRSSGQSPPSPDLQADRHPGDLAASD